MSNVPLPRPGPLGLIQYAGIDMLQYAGKISAAKDAEISELQNFKTMHLEMVAKWAGDIGEALGEPSEDFKPDDLIALAGKVKIQRDALRADNIRLQNEVVMPQPEPVARVAEVHMSRYTIEWTNGPLPEGTGLYAAPPAAPAPVEDFCYCNDEISLQMVSGGAAPEGLYGRVTLKIDGKYVEYVRAESAAPVIIGGGNG